MNGVESYNESVQVKRWNMVFSLLVEMDIDDEEMIILESIK